MYIIESLKTWNDANKRGIWFKIALEHCEFIPLLAKVLKYTSI